MIGIIGGSGLDEFEGLKAREVRELSTPYGEPSAPLMLGELGGREVVFLARHGQDHRLAPHRINYRANVWALQELGVRRIVAVAAVGSIAPNLAPGELVLPHDLIDYSWGRAHSYSDAENDRLQHVEFAPPYCETLRTALLNAARQTGIELHAQAVYGVTQGPRLETAAEIRRLARDGCDLVGMTGMPEAGLARELSLPYACLAVVVNWAAGVGEGAIHAEIETHIAQGMSKARRVIGAFIQA